MPKDPCSELSKTITELAMNIGSDPKFKTLADVAAEMQKHIPEITRAEIVASINEATSGYARARTEIEKNLDSLRREARTDVGLQKAVAEYKKAIAEGRQPPKPKPGKPAPKEIQALRDELNATKAKIAEADPAKREAIRKRIAELDALIAKGEPPVVKPRKAAPADLEALRRERDTKYQQARKAGQKPATIAALNEQIKELDKHIAAGTMPPKKSAPVVDADIAALREKRNAKMREAAKADPATRERLRQQIAEINDHIKAGTVPDKKPKTAPPADVAALRAERDRLATQMRKFDPARVEAAKARVAELEKHLKDGTLPTPKPGTPEANPEVAKLNSAADQLRAALRQSEPAIKARYEKQIASLLDRLENGVELPGDGKPAKTESRELERLRYERDKLRTQVREEINRLKPKTVWGRFKTGKEAVRQLVVGGDLGVIFRQGGFNALSRPIQHTKTIADLANAVKDPIKAREIMQSIEDSPWRPLSERAGLKIANIENITDGTRFKEEGYGSVLNRAAPFRAIERGNQVFLNKLRFDRFTAMCETLAKNGEPTLAEAQAIARFANESSGAASKGGAEAFMNFAGNFMFSPSYQVSRLQTLMGHSLWGGSWRTRKLIAKEYARAVTGGAVLVTIASQMGFKVGSDERSSDFGKIILPDGTRIDPWAGLSQYVVLGGRLKSGESVSRAGRVTPLTGPKARRTRMDVVGTFVRSKLDPVTGTAVDLLSNQKNVIGEDVDAADLPQKLLLPLSYQDIYQSFRDDGMPEAMAKSLLTISGVGVQSEKK